MSSLLRNLKMLTGAKWWKWSSANSGKEGADTGTGTGTGTGVVYDETHRIGQLELGKILIFKGKWLPSVTVQPRFEAWRHNKKSQPADPKTDTIFRSRNLVIAGAGLLVVIGVVYYLRRQQKRKRFEAKVAKLAALRDAVSGAFEGAVFQEAIAQALQNAAHNDQNTMDVVDGAFVRALQHVGVKEAIGEALRDAIVHLQNVTAAQEVTLSHMMDASGEQEKVTTNLGTFVQTLGVLLSEAALESGAVTIQDLATSSVSELLERGIPQGNAVKMQRAVKFLLSHPLV